MNAGNDNRKGALTIRFSPKNDTVGHLCFDMNKENFESRYCGLVLNESYNGCCFAMIKNEKLMEGQMCLIQHGPFNPMKAQIKWVKQVDEFLCKVGLEIQE